VLLEVDLFGTIRCNRDYFVEWHDESCYPILSPAEVCPQGQQIRWKSNNSLDPECFQSECPPGELVWSDGKCYKYQEQDTLCRDFLQTNGTHIICQEEGRKEEEEDSQIFSLLSAFGNCPTDDCAKSVARLSVDVSVRTICEVLNMCDNTKPEDYTKSED